MSKLEHGTVSITFPDTLALDESSGKLSQDEVLRIPKAPRGIGLICDTTADALEKAGAKFTAPAGVTPESLRAAGARAEGIDQVILDLEVVMNTLKQGNLLMDAAAWEQVRKMNDQVKSQGKHDAELLVIFKPLLDFFVKGPRPTGPTPTS
jgi:hypothetical protein